MKLIDVEHIPYEDGFDRENGNEHFINGIETMQEWIRQQPVISPEDLVKHGAWMVCCIGWKCSECGCIVSPNHISNYCPDCGAKMQE